MFVFYIRHHFILVHLRSFLFVTGINDDYLTANIKILLQITYFDSISQATFRWILRIDIRHKVLCIRKGERKTEYEKEGKKAKEEAKNYDGEGFFNFLLLFSANFLLFFVLLLTPYFGNSDIVNPYFFF